MVKRTRQSSITQNEGGFEQQITYLPICVVSHIISRLPAEIILRCRCVCKSWYALTHEPCFIMKHYQWSKNHEASRYMLQVPHGPGSQYLSLLDIHERKIMNIPFNQMKLPMPTYPNQCKLSSYSFVCACNGWLCFAPQRKMDNAVICNPITTECLVLPSTTMAFPLKPLVSYQLGFHLDEYSGKYKVIREFRFFNNQPSKYQLITVIESSWKDLDPPNCIVEQGFDAAVFWNGAFHWKLSEIVGQRNNYILSFDLKEEKFFTIAYPRDDESYYCPRNYKLCELGGSLKIVEHWHSRLLKIWKVIGYKSEGYSIVLQHTYTLCIPPRRMLEHQVISQLDEETYVIHITWKPGIDKSSLQIFSLGNILRDFHIDDLPPFFKIITFKPTLISPLA